MEFDPLADTSIATSECELDTEEISISEQFEIREQDLVLVKSYSAENVLGTAAVLGQEVDPLKLTLNADADEQEWGNLQHVENDAEFTGLGLVFVGPPLKKLKTEVGSPVDREEVDPFEEDTPQPQGEPVQMQVQVGESVMNTNTNPIERVEGFGDHQDTKESIRLGNPAFKYRKNYRKHYDKVELKYSYKCWYCPADTTRLHLFHRHKMHHLQTFKVKCPECTFSTGTQTGLNRHLVCHTPAYRQSAVAKFKNLRKKFGLPLKGPNSYKEKYAKLKRSMQRHKLLHESEIASIKCPHGNCPLSFPTQDDLDRHMLEHEQGETEELEMPVLTPEVDVASGMHLESSELQIETVQHTQQGGQLVYACVVPKCPENFANMKEFLNHKKRHFDRRSRYKCEECSFAVSRPSLLRQHQKLHQEHADGEQTKPEQNPTATPASEEEIEIEAEVKEIDVPVEKYAQQRVALSDAARRLIGGGSGSKTCRNQEVCQPQSVSPATVKCEIESDADEDDECVPVAIVTRGIELPLEDACKLQPEPIQRVEQKEKEPEKAVVQKRAHSAHTKTKVVQPPKPKPNILISTVKIENFMGQEDASLEFDCSDSNLHCLQGGSNSGKTTAIVACLLGLGYDNLVDLQPTNTICGVDINNVVQSGKENGLIELTLNLTSHPELKDIYGNEIILRRYPHSKAETADAPIVLTSKGHEAEVIPISELKFIMDKLVPASLLKFMVLNGENVQYLTENFEICQNVFETLVNEEKSKKKSQKDLVSRNLKFLKSDLAVRKSRIVHLQEVVRQIGGEDLCRSQLRDLYTAELELALEQRGKVKTLYKKLVKQKNSTERTVDHSMVEFKDKIRKPFQKFVEAQNLTGDIVFGGTDGLEFVMWIKETPIASTTNNTNEMLSLDEARQVWKSMTLGRKKLSVMGLIISFWRIMDSCPIFLGDLYTTAQNCEFHLPEDVWSTVYSVTQEEPSRQFILSVPAKTRQDFITKFT